MHVLNLDEIFYIILFDSLVWLVNYHTHAIVYCMAEHNDCLNANIQFTNLQLSVISVFNHSRLSMNKIIKTFIVL